MSLSRSGSLTFVPPALQERVGYDVLLLLLTLALCVGGTIFVLSASSAHATVAFHGNSFAIFQNHALRLGMGLCAMLILSLLDYHRIQRKARGIWIAAMAALIAVLVLPQPPGVTAHRWLYLFGISFQPAEFAKYSLIAYIAMRFAGSDSERFVTERRKLYIGALLVTLLTAGFVVVEPNLSMTLMILITAAFLFFLCGAPIKALSGLAAAVIVPLGLIGWFTPYMHSRLVSYTDAVFHPMRAGYQVKQSLIGIGQGGILGLGLGESTQKHFFLPEPYKDFIFSIVGEELGIVGALVMLAGFTLLIARAWRISLSAPDRFGYYLGAGITFILAVSFLVNIGVTLGLLPTTGQPLPFISFGGSSLIMNLAAVGVLLNISRQTQRRSSLMGQEYPYL
ncbi:MAG: FtsW/RodA/SpoVE family cell cycle protein [bacterium]|nr:FtsW/RodA/SpoVE family cell cycle protein [bacterium]